MNGQHNKKEGILFRHLPHHYVDISKSGTFFLIYSTENL